MLHLAAVVSPYFAFEQSDSVGRAIVIVLLVGSIIGWTIMIDKLLLIGLLRRQLNAFLRFYDKTRAPDEVLLQRETYRGPLADVAGSALTAMAEIQQVPERDLEGVLRRSGIPPAMTKADLDRVDSAMEAQVDAQILRLEENLTLLGSVVSASPFLGLLGTVWGVMMAFCGMAAKGQPDINTLAPGVSGALLTTVVGLIVAIPSLVGYNLVLGAIRDLTVKMENFSAEFISRIRVASQESS